MAETTSILNGKVDAEPDVAYIENVTGADVAVLRRLKAGSDEVGQTSEEPLTDAAWQQLVDRVHAALQQTPVPPTGLAWTDKQPTVAGWYFVERYDRPGAEMTVDMVQVHLLAGGENDWLPAVQEVGAVLSVHSRRFGRWSDRPVMAPV